MNRHEQAHFLSPLQSGFRSFSDSGKGAAVVVVLALVIKLFLMALLHAKSPNTDGIKYLLAARDLAGGDVRAALAIHQMLGYPLLIAGAHLVIPDWVTAARALSLFGLVGATLFLYFITDHLFGRRAAFWASLAFTLSPFQNEMTLLIYRGPVYLFVFAWAVLWMLKTMDDPHVGRIVAAAWIGLLSGWFRIEGVFLTPVYLLCLLIAALAFSENRRRIIAGGSLWILSFFLVTAGAYALAGDSLIDTNRFWQVRDKIHLLIDGGLLDRYRDIHSQLKAIEAGSLLPSEDQNFGEVARQFMWLIYLIGLIQIVIQVLFPIYLVPMAAGLTHRWNRSRGMVAAVFFFYMAMLYMLLIEQDFTNERFVFAGVFLLYPWVGRGMARVVDWTAVRATGSWVWAAFWVCAVGLPAVANIDHMTLPDQSAVHAGRWIAASEFKEGRIIGNDSRIAYAAGIFPYDNNGQFRHYHPESRNFRKIERIAIRNNYDLIVLKFRKNRLDRLPSFKRFIEVKRFDYGEKITFVFADPKRYPVRRRLPPASGSSP